MIANLAPRQMKFGVSEGMVLAAGQVVQSFICSNLIKALKQGIGLVNERLMEPMIEVVAEHIRSSTFGRASDLESTN